jgi:glycosyltransferase involved in cell wall biosynthesis
MSRPFISIAMATFNGELFLKEQLDSIYKQTYKNFEVVVFDDASNDGTCIILEEFHQKHKLKYFVNKINVGVTKNFDQVISHCNGDYILLADQDDIWLSNKIEILIECIGEYSLIYSNAGIIDKNGKLMNKTAYQTLPLFGLDSSKEDLFHYLLLNSFILGCSMLFKRELLSNLFPVYESSRNHDWWITLCASRCKGIKYIDDVLFYYRLHPNNYSGQGPKVTFFNFFGAKSRLDRKKKAEVQSDICKYYLKNNIYNTVEEKNYLVNILNLCDSFLNTRIHWRAFYFTIMYHKYMFFVKNKFKRILLIFAKLLG